jgi:hypothetical protein
MNKIFLISLLILLAGCTKNQVICTAETVAVDAMTPAIATALQCSSSDAISQSLTSWLNSSGFCSNSSMGMANKDKLDAPTCSIITSIVLSSASGNIPASWGCTAANAQALLSAAINKACLNI